MPANTPNHLLPYPIPDDTVDVPRDIQALATTLDAITSLKPPVVTSIPTNPIDGQEFYWEYALAAAPLGAHSMLHYRYNAASNSWLILNGTIALTYNAPFTAPGSSMNIDLGQGGTFEVVSAVATGGNTTPVTAFKITYANLAPTTPPFNTLYVNVETTENCTANIHIIAVVKPLSMPNIAISSP